MGSRKGDVHELRIDGKLLRYTLELAAPLGFGAPMPLLRAFKQLQDALGLWHDYVVLGEQTLRYALDQQLPLHNSSSMDRRWTWRTVLATERALARAIRGALEEKWRAYSPAGARGVRDEPSQAGKAQSASNNGYRLIAKAPSTAKSR
jgi:CHAD domain-containing protein